MRPITYALLPLVAALASAGAQTRAAPAALPVTPPGIPPASEQLVAAVLPLPVPMRDSATVYGYAGDGRFVTLRHGSGDMVCLASDPKSARFHVACYHRSLEPFMARGRELRAQGITGERVDTVRFAEARAGLLRLPPGPALLYSLTGGTFDPVAGTVTGARPLFVVYIPNATAESTGLSARPLQNAPWIMLPGTPKAHIMFTPAM